MTPTPMPPSAHLGVTKSDERTTWWNDPVFIVGSPRSGSTLLRLILNAHCNFSVPPESEMLQRAPALLGKRVYQRRELNKVVGKMLTLKEPFSHVGLDVTAGDLRRIFEPVLPCDAKVIIARFFTYWAEVNGKPGTRWGEKKPQTWPYIYRLREWYPQSQFIHLVRDPRDSLASWLQYFPHFIKGRRLAKPHLIIAWFWRLTNGKIGSQGASLGAGRYLRVRYEDLVGNPTKECLRICEFLNEQFDPNMLKYHTDVKRGDAKSDPHALTAEPVQSRRIGRGKTSISEQQRGDIEFVCRKRLRQYGYQADAKAISKFRALLLTLMCLGFGAAWTSFRAWRRIRGSL
jgi:hypothetical protein